MWAFSQGESVSRRACAALPRVALPPARHAALPQARALRHPLRPRALCCYPAGSRAAPSSAPPRRERVEGVCRPLHLAAVGPPSRREGEGYGPQQDAIVRNESKMMMYNLQRKWRMMAVIKEQSWTLRVQYYCQFYLTRDSSNLWWWYYSCWQSILVCASWLGSILDCIGLTIVFCILWSNYNIL